MFTKNLTINHSSFRLNKNVRYGNRITKNFSPSSFNIRSFNSGDTLQKPSLNAVTTPEALSDIEQIPEAIKNAPLASVIVAGLLPNPFLLQKQVGRLKDELDTANKELIAAHKELLKKANEVVKKTEEVVATQKEVVATQKEVVATQKEVVKKAEEAKNEVLAAQKEVVATQKEVVKKAEEAKNEVLAAQKEVVATQNEVLKKAEEVAAFKTSLILKNNELDSFKGKRDLRGLLESIRDEINKTRRLSGQTSKLTATDVINLLFDDKDSLIGAPFMNFLRQNLTSNNVVEKDVLAAGKQIYGKLSSNFHGSKEAPDLRGADFVPNDIFVLSAIYTYHYRDFEYISDGKVASLPYTFTAIPAPPVPLVNPVMAQSSQNPKTV